MDDDFSAFTVPQLRNHCAANSLSYCLYLLGIEATQRDLARAAGVPPGPRRPALASARESVSPADSQ